MAGQKSSTVGRKGLVLWLTALTILYQVVYQVVMWRVLQHEVSEEEECSAVVDTPPSRQCLEAQLFHSWEQSMLEKPLLQVRGNRSVEQISVESAVVALGRAELREPFDEKRRKLLESHLASEEALLAALKKEAVPESDAHHLAAWAREIGDLRQKLQAGEWNAFVTAINDSAAPGSFSAVTDERTEVARATGEDTKKREAVNGTRLKPGHSESDETTNLLSLSESIEQLHRELCEDPERRGRKICSDYLASVAEKAKAERAKVHAARAARRTEILQELREHTEKLEEHKHMPKLDGSPGVQGERTQGEQEGRRGLRGARPSETPRQEEKSEWSQMFRDMVRQSEREMCEEPHRRHRPDCVKLLAEIKTAERQEAAEELSAHSAELEAELQTAAEDHEIWERKFEEKVRRAHVEMCKDGHRRHRADCEKYLAEQPAEPTQSATGEQTELQDASSLETAAPETWSHAFMHELHKAEREMCMEPHRRNRPDCVELLADIERSEHQEEAEGRDKKQATAAKGLLERSARLAAHVKTAEEGHAEWGRRFEEKVRRTHRELCNDPVRRERPDCAEFLADFAASEEVLPSSPQSVGTGKQSVRTSSLRQGRRQLHWETVAAFSVGSSWFPAVLVGSPTPLESGPLETAGWVGVSPKVACITAVPRGVDSSQMAEVVRNFRLQSYVHSGEGFARLILVYQFGDQVAEDLVRSFADGFQVQGVAAREDAFATTALRFGAWQAVRDGMQAVAHWSFSANHHPKRLSLQLRAMAFSSRPASTLLRSSLTVSSMKWEETLVGEARWMRQHWHPLSTGQRPFLEGLVGDQVVEVRVGEGQDA